MVTRFDFTPQQRDTLNAAVRIGLVDAVDLACIVATHAAHFAPIATELDEIAHTLRTGNRAEQQIKKTWNDIRESINLLERQAKAEHVPDRFGFAAEAKEHSQGVLQAHSIRWGDERNAE